MKIKDKTIPVILLLVNFAWLAAIIYRSEILKSPRTSGESLFVFSSMALLAQPIPSLVGSLLSKVLLLERIMRSHLGLILYAAITGSIQWGVVGMAISGYLRKAKTGIFEKLNFAILLLLSLTFTLYTISVLFASLSDLRGFTEKSFVILWAIMAVLIPICFIKWLIDRTPSQGDTLTRLI